MGRYRTISSLNPARWVEENKTKEKSRDAECLKVVNELKVKLKTCEHDYWFMINLLEKYSTDKDQAIKDCIERMKFRKPIFETAKADQMLKEMGMK